MFDSISWITGEKQSNWIKEILLLRQGIWPDYQRLDKSIILKLYSQYPLLQWLALYNSEVVAIINSMPVFFNQSLNNLPQEGINWILSQLHSSNSARKRNYLAAVSVTVHPAYQGLGLSKILIQRLKKSAEENRYKALIIPARPSKKSMYPLIPIDDYLQWKRPDKTFFDPWLHIHAQMGGIIAYPCNKSRYIKASVDQWEQWLKIPLFQTGQYLIPDGLNPMMVNKEDGVGVYIEPNVWIIYH